MGRKASKEPSKRETAKLMRVAESFGEFASMCFAKFKSS
jgi:hypothetical protein